MMLSKDQIQQVENYLTQKGLKYIDIRYEVLDHISSDIEQMMETRGLSFENASDIVFLKWNRNFVSRSNIWIGLIYSGPKIFIDHSVIIYKKFILKIQLIVFAVIIGLGKIFVHFNTLWINYEQQLTYFFKTIAAIILIVVLYWFYQIRKTKLNTSYSFLFTRNILPFGLFFGTMSLLSEGNLMLLTFIIYSSWSGWKLFKHHIKSISLYSYTSTK